MEVGQGKFDHAYPVLQLGRCWVGCEKTKDPALGGEP